MYTRPFTEQVKGRLDARFLLDVDGAPQYEPDAKHPDLRDYPVDLFLYSPRAAEIDVVTYYLMDPGFSAREIQSEDEPNDFRVGIQTYCDVQINVTVNIMSVLYKQRALLSEMLENGHARNMTAAVRDAIDRIRRRG